MDAPICHFYGRRTSKDTTRERVVPFDTGSERSLKTVQRWIKRCDDGHKCMRNVVLKMPRRVLDVRDDHVRLLETTTEDEGARYACLSHCWGARTDAMLRTTLSTLSSFTKTIPWADLPRTFQHAISVTRRLGVDFLWIDSLCIIQDDERDWQQQPVVMATIYQNAYITIAATASSNADGGCYTREDNLQLNRAGMPLAVLSYANDTKQQIYARRRLSHDMKQFPLLHRGWV